MLLITVTTYLFAFILFLISPHSETHDNNHQPRVLPLIRVLNLSDYLMRHCR
ncbi:hypothetical protein BDV34DRAFT_197166 [Aspergillus parasiticus]|uniref:Uncharacterized protein n=1 Tax=Aspergillus parasiticus TaxID=5067 RepID=A0A5N6DHP0_ASPPA|nr:hypothetical protein BDV34DRAFT_197166 [Aspergillus parasiticus]